MIRHTYLTDNDLQLYPELESFVCYTLPNDPPTYITRKQRDNSNKYEYHYRKKENKIEYSFICHRLTQCSRYNSYYYCLGDEWDASHRCHYSECFRTSHGILENHNRNTNRCGKGYLYVRNLGLIQKLCTCDDDDPCINLTIIDNLQNDIKNLNF